MSLSRQVWVCGLVVGLMWVLTPVVVRAQGGAAKPQGALAQSLYTLLTPQMMKELDIIPQQKTDLEKLSKSSQTRMTEAFKKYNEVPPEERGNFYQDKMREVNVETEKQLRDILLPHQIRRIQQINLQTKLQQLQYGGSAALVADELAQELGITPEQKAEMAKMEKEVREDIQKKTQEFYKKMQEEAREKMMSVLKAEQRRKLEALTGEKFEWKYEAPKPIEPKKQ